MITTAFTTIFLLGAYEIIRFVFITILLESFVMKTTMIREKEELENNIEYLRNEVYKESTRLWEIKMNKFV